MPSRLPSLGTAMVTQPVVTSSFSHRFPLSLPADQRALYNLGLTSIPIINVNNNCSTGSSALYLANNAVKSSITSCALALGFERMNPGSLGTSFPDRPSPTTLLGQRNQEIEVDGLGINHGPMAPRMFANGAQEYFDKYGAGIEHLAKIGACCLNLVD